MAAKRCYPIKTNVTTNSDKTMQLARAYSKINVIDPFDERFLTARHKLQKSILDDFRCGNLNQELAAEFASILYEIDDIALDRILTTCQTMNVNIHANIACVIDAILNSSGDQTNIISRHIRDWFINPYIIGSVSTFGYAMSTSLSPNSSLFVVKTARKEGGADMLHEACIGTILNSLRRFTPIFPYTYAVSNCSKPISHEGQKFISNWCNPNSKRTVDYLFMENVKNSMTLNEFIVNIVLNKIELNILEILNIFLILFDGLHTANLQYGFVHHDLHADNILIRTYDEPVIISITLPSGDPLFIRSHYIPYVIDFGMSAITYNKIKFTYYDDYPPTFDSYKLLGFCGENTLRVPTSNLKQQETQKVLFTIFSDMFKIFKQDLAERVNLAMTNYKPEEKIQDLYNCDNQFGDQDHETMITNIIKIYRRYGGGFESLTSLKSTGGILAPLDVELTNCNFIAKYANGQHLTYEAYNVARDLLLKEHSDFESQQLIDALNSKFDADKLANDMVFLIDDINEDFEYAPPYIRTLDLEFLRSMKTVDITSYIDQLYTLFQARENLTLVQNRYSAYLDASSTLPNNVITDDYCDNIELLINNLTVFIARKIDLIQSNIDLVKSDIGFGIIRSRALNGELSRDDVENLAIVQNEILETLKDV